MHKCMTPDPKDRFWDNFAYLIKRENLDLILWGVISWLVFTDESETVVYTCRLKSFFTLRYWTFEDVDCVWLKADNLLL